MVETLEYQFKEGTTSGAPLEVKGPKAFIDEVIYSTRGPMFDDVKAQSGRAVMGMIADKEGNVTLDFDQNTNGRLRFHGPADMRSRQTLAIIAQLDRQAHRLGVADPRITIGLTPIAPRDDAPMFRPSGEDFRVAFEHPTGDVLNAAARMQSAMTRAAGVTYLYSKTDHTTSVRVTPIVGSGMEVRMGLHGSDRVVMNGSELVTSGADRIELVEQAQYTDAERLVVLCGVIAVLPRLAD